MPLLGQLEAGVQLLALVEGAHPGRGPLQGGRTRGSTLAAAASHSARGSSSAPRVRFSKRA